MSIKKSEIAKCGACRFYTPVGRRGGECSQLSVPVQSAWKVCCLAQAPFKSVTQMCGPVTRLPLEDAPELFPPLPVTPRAFQVLESVPEAELFTRVST